MIVLPDGQSIECDANQVSDGFHTVGELYEHRCLLFLGMMNLRPGISWASKLHADGTMWEGWFIAGMDLPTGRITYHLPIKMWDMLPVGQDFNIRNHAPEHDGHTSADVLDRLTKWLS